MQTIALHGQVSENGVLKLEVPFDTYGEAVEVLVVVQSSPHRPPLSLQELAGAIEDDTLVEPSELPLEKREALT
ncbi:hypothetical protein IAD21_04130 [Abditibacteriota bacterium]|nr:hypothetical protein IAD21_04130 [Abditibacteriota bacterium]